MYTMSRIIHHGLVYNSPQSGLNPDGYDAFCDREVFCQKGYTAQMCGEKGNPHVVCVDSSIQGGRTKMKRPYKKRKLRKRTKRIR